MIDTHTHLYMPEFSLEGQTPDSLEGQRMAVDRAIAAGVTRMIFPGVDRSSVEPMLMLASFYSANVAVALGLHPTEVKEDWKQELDYILSLIPQTSNCVAIGEAGIDLYWDKQYEKEQIEAFDTQVAAAVAAGLPLIIHCRDGLDQTLEVLQSYPYAKAVFHSFGGSVADVERIRRCGDYFFGINGIVTFKNSNLRSVLPEIGITRILTETDSPYLSPAPLRGQRNESARIPYILNTIAQALGMDAAEAENIISLNSEKLFGF